MKKKFYSGRPPKYSRALRQFKHNQKVGKSIVNLKPTLGGHLCLKRSILWIQNELRSGGGCNLYISQNFDVIKQSVMARTRTRRPVAYGKTDTENPRLNATLKSFH